MEYDELENTEFAGFAIGPILGRSASCVTYAATKDKIPFVLKVLPPLLGESKHHAASRFLQALEIASTLSHENLVRFLSIDEAEGLRFAVLERVEGLTLAKMIEKRGALPLQEGAGILGQIFQGLDAGHKAGLVHGGLDAAKLILDPAGKWKITGFGFPTRYLFEAGVALTEAGMEGDVCLCPESVEGSEIGTRSDLYAVGVIAYEVFTGTSPFTAGSEEELRNLHATETPPAPADVNTWLPPFVSDFVLKLLAKDPAERFSGASAAFRAMEAALAGRPLSEEEGPEPEAPSGEAPSDEPERGSLLASIWEAERDAVPEVEEPAAEEPETEKPEKRKRPKRPTQVVRGVFASLDGSSALGGGGRGRGCGRRPAREDGCRSGRDESRAGEPGEDEGPVGLRIRKRRRVHGHLRRLLHDLRRGGGYPPRKAGDRGGGGPRGHSGRLRR